MNFFIIWNNSMSGTTLIIIYHDYIGVIGKVKNQSTLIDHWQTKNNSTYLFHAKTWFFITSFIKWDCRCGFE